MKKIFLNVGKMCLKLVNNNHLIVENYENVLNISINEITLSKYIIKGDDLVVKKMDEFAIEIFGKIQEIKIIDV